MTIKELKELIKDLPDDMKVYHCNYNVAGYLEDESEVQSNYIGIPENSYPVPKHECLILDCEPE